MTIPCQKLMSCIIRTNSRFGATYVVEVLLGSRNKRILDNGHNMISTWGIGRELDKNQWLYLVSLLIEKNFLVKAGDYGILMLTNDGLNALKNRDEIRLPFDFGKSETESQNALRSEGSFIPKNRSGSGATGGLLFPKPAGKGKKTGLKAEFVLVKKNSENQNLTDEKSLKIISVLKKWRKATAEKMNVPPYVIFGDKTLRDIASKKPTTIESLMDCNGIGENKADRFGQAIIEQLKTVL